MRAPVIVLLVVSGAVACRRDEAPPPARWSPPAVPSGSAAAPPEIGAPIVFDTDPIEAGVDALTIEQLALGNDQRCVLMSNRSVRCWGEREWNALAGTHDARKMPPMRGLRDVAQLALGYAHGCALLVDRTVKCWGSSAMGRLGDGAAVDRSTAVPVPGLSGVTQLAAGGNHTCARLEAGTVRCWGANDAGQLGIAAAGAPGKYTPFEHRAVPRPVDALTGVAELALGNQHTCARTAEGTVFCWGDARSGQLGIEGSSEYVPRPMLVDGLRDVVQLVAAYEHTCARLADGSVKCWGKNAVGELGDGTQIARPRPTIIDAFRGATDLRVAAVRTCASAKDGTVRCTGRGERTTPSSSLSPVAIEGVRDVRQLALGSGSCALLADRAVACWGISAPVTRFSW